MLSSQPTRRKRRIQPLQNSSLSPSARSVGPQHGMLPFQGFARILFRTPPPPLFSPPPRPARRCCGGRLVALRTPPLSLASPPPPAGDRGGRERGRLPEKFGPNP